jgi:hypothetical protein
MGWLVVVNLSTLEFSTPEEALTRATQVVQALESDPTTSGLIDQVRVTDSLNPEGY